MSFDLQAPFDFFGEAVKLALDFPDTSIAVNHAGLPSDRSAQGLASWRRAMAELSRCPNVFVKISGLGLPGKPWRVSDNRAIVLTLIDSFGSERCMFASNFPVDGLVASFDEIYSGFIEIAQDLSSAEQKQLFCDNAVRFYRL